MMVPMMAADSASAKCVKGKDVEPSPSNAMTGACAEFAVATDANEWVAGFEPGRPVLPLRAWLRVIREQIYIQLEAVGLVSFS